MTELSCRGGPRRRPSVILLLAASVTVACSQAVSQIAHFIIVENSKHLIAYDSFQRSLTAAQRDAFLPFMPMKILESHVLLGDGMTRCTKVEADGNILYVLEDEHGELAGRKNLGPVRSYAGIAFLQDTISILASDKMPFQGAAGNRSYLSAGDRCIRYFNDGGSWYVKRLGRDPAYGWIRNVEAGRGAWWEVVRPEAVHSELSSSLLERIEERIRGANRTLARVYAVLNSQTGKRLIPPRWSLDRRGESLRFELLPDSAITEYPKSVEALTASLQTYVLGTGLEVAGAGGEIVIRPR
jgi:hypothetical protein